MYNRRFFKEIIMEEIQKDTEQLLIAGAISYIAKYGYQNLSVRKFTKEINLTTGAFYKHFKDKQELYTKILELLSQEFIDNMPKIDNESPIEQLISLSNYFISQAEKYPNIINFILFTESNARYVFNSKVNGCSLKVKFNQLAKELNHSHLSDEDFFLQIWSFIQGYLLMVKNGLTQYNPQLVDSTLRQLVKKR